MIIINIMVKTSDQRHSFNKTPKNGLISSFFDLEVFSSSPWTPLLLKLFFYSLFGLCLGYVSATLKQNVLRVLVQVSTTHDIFYFSFRSS